MWINVRRGSYGHTRGMNVNENTTIADFWSQVVSKCSISFFFKHKNFNTIVPVRVNPDGRWPSYSRDLVVRDLVE